MKNLIIKADRKVLDVLTQYVRRWVQRHDNKKHAIDFMIQFEWLQFWALLLWAIAIPAVLYAVEGSPLAAGIHTGIWSLLAIMEWIGIQQTKRILKPAHDLFFSLREEPSYVKMHAEVLEQVFVQSRRTRLKLTAFVIGLTAVIYLIVHFTIQTTPDNLVWQYLFANAIASRLKHYLLYVNDMEPPQKKKKASEAISEMLQQLWGELTGGFVPQPAFRYELLHPTHL